MTLITFELMRILCASDGITAVDPKICIVDIASVAPKTEKATVDRYLLIQGCWNRASGGRDSSLYEKCLKGKK